MLLFVFIKWMFHERAPLLLEWLPLAQTEMTLGSGFSRDSDEIVLHLATCVYTVWRAWWLSCSGAAAGCCQRQLWVSCWHHELSVLVKRWWQKVVCSGIRVPAPGSELAACHQSPGLRFRWTPERSACGLCLHRLNCSCVYGPAPGSLLYPSEEETRTISSDTSTFHVCPSIHPVCDGSCWLLIRSLRFHLCLCKTSKSIQRLQLRNTCWRKHQLNLNLQNPLMFSKPSSLEVKWHLWFSQQELAAGTSTSHKPLAHFAQAQDKSLWEANKRAREQPAGL